MGNSVTVPATEPPGSFDHKTSGGHLRIFWKNGQLQHEIGQSGFTAQYPAAYSIGFGKVGKSYLVEIDGRLFQSPAAFYPAKNAWAESPGYENDPVLDFWRSIDASCLSCHAGSVGQTDNHTTLSAITCDRCHGDPARHLRSPVPGSIVNPAKLSLRKRDAVCEQCHLEGAATILNPGRHWGEFHPGSTLEDVQTTYVLQSDAGGLAAVSHVEQLALSACKRADPARLWCVTCHDPHSPAGDHRPDINATCHTCHAAAQLAATHKVVEVNCLACHMPKLRAADISHAAITDHRILKRPGQPPDKVGSAARVVPWVPPAADLAQRNLALALFNLAREAKPGGSYPESFRLLSVNAPSPSDAPAAAAQGYMLLGSGHTQPAIACFQSAIAADGQSAEYWLDLAVAQQANGDTTAAENSLRESIRRNPADYRPYQVLAELLEKQGRKSASAAVLRDFLQVNPQSILIRLRQAR